MTHTDPIDMIPAAHRGSLIPEPIPEAHSVSVVGGVTPEAHSVSVVGGVTPEAHSGRVAADATKSPAAAGAAGWSPGFGRGITPYGPLDSPGEIVAVAHRTVAICDTQPVVAEGVRNLLGANGDLKLLETTDSLRNALDRVGLHMPDVLLVDKAFGIQAILDWLSQLRPVLDTDGRPGVVIWGVSISEAEALRFLQAGARGILRKTAPVQVVLACLRTVAAGRSWMEESVFRDLARSERYPRSELTTREQQVLELVEQGFKNKDIGQELGIRPGTVKIHLKHIFEKTGVRGRYGLALNGLKERTIMALPAQASAL